MVADLLERGQQLEHPPLPGDTRAEALLVEQGSDRGLVQGGLLGGEVGAAAAADEIWPRIVSGISGLVTGEESLEVECETRRELSYED